MEINNIEIISSSVISETTFNPKLMICFVDKSTLKFYEFDLRVSSEFLQDIKAYKNGDIEILIKEMLVDNLNICEEVNCEYMLRKFGHDEKIKKYILPYLREDKINKLIN